LLLDKKKLNFVVDYFDRIAIIDGVMTNTTKEYNERHGGAYDRGSADAWYRRACVPHYYKGATGSSERVHASEMTPEQVEAYVAGFDEGMEWGEHKDYS
jgi:hypothetical protein